MAYATLCERFVGESTQEPPASSHGIPKRTAILDYSTASASLPRGYLYPDTAPTGTVWSLSTPPRAKI